MHSVGLLNIPALFLRHRAYSLRITAQGHIIMVNCRLLLLFSEEIDLKQTKTSPQSQFAEQSNETDLL